MGLYGVDIREFGADICHDDNAPYIADAAAYAGSDKTLIIPDGVYRHATTPIVIDQADGMHITSMSTAGTLLATDAHPSIIIDATNQRIDHGEIKNLRLASLVNTQGADGIRVIGNPAYFVNGWRFSDIRFSGLYNGIACQKGEQPFGGVNVSLFSGNVIDNWMVDEWESNKTQRGLFADGVNTLTITGGYSRAEISTVAIGSGTIGWGDFIMTGVHTNYGQYSVQLVGSSQPEDYRHNAVIVGNQFDGNNTCNIYARNLRCLQEGLNSYASGIPNDIRDCRQSMLMWNPSHVEDSVLKEPVSAGVSPAVFMLHGPTGGGGYGSAMVEITMTATLSGIGGVVWKAFIPVRWAGQVPTAGNTQVLSNWGASGAVVSVGCYRNNDPTSVNYNALIFVIYHNSTGPDSRFLVGVKVDGDGFRYCKC